MSHLTYVRQKNRDHGVPLSELSLEVTDHDRERAEDTVAELERLGVYRGASVGPAPADDQPPHVAQSPANEAPSTDAPSDDSSGSEPPDGESRRQEVTDLWGNPLSSRRRRRKR